MARSLRFRFRIYGYVVDDQRRRSKQARGNRSIVIHTHSPTQELRYLLSPLNPKSYEFLEETPMVSEPEGRFLHYGRNDKLEESRFLAS